MFLITPIMESNNTSYTNIGTGISQGSILSPILMNIMLHQLYLFSIELCNELVGNHKNAPSRYGPINYINLWMFLKSVFFLGQYVRLSFIIIPMC